MNVERLRKAPNIAIVGSSSPLGKELKDMLHESGFPVGELILMETEEYAGLLQEFAGQIQITQVVSPRSLEEADIVFLTCSPEIIKAYLASGSKFPEVTIDLTETRSEGTLFLSGISDPGILKAARYIVNPHPATIVLARSLSVLHRGFGVHAASATILEPASARGKAGVEELQEQAVHLLNFQEVAHRVFEDQLAFNVLAEPESCHQTEELVRGQFKDLLMTAILTPRLTVVQAPVFHSHSFSMFVELGSSPGVDQLRRLFEKEGSTMDLNAGGKSSPSPVSTVGSDKIHIGRIAADPIHPRSYSIWMVADNLRVSAAAAIQTVEHIVFAGAPGS